MSSDRQAKVAACELLHSMVIYMVGRGAQKATGETERHPMEALYRRLFPIIITLACDVEQVSILKTFIIFVHTSVLFNLLSA